MTVRVFNVYRDEPGKIIDMSIQLSTPQDIKRFELILNRSLNCWPEAPADWKELSDMLTHGKILQDYKHMEKNHQKKEQA